MSDILKTKQLSRALARTAGLAWFVGWISFGGWWVHAQSIRRLGWFELFFPLLIGGWVLVLFLGQALISHLLAPAEASTSPKLPHNAPERSQDTFVKPRVVVRDSASAYSVMNYLKVLDVLLAQQRVQISRPPEQTEQLEGRAAFLVWSMLERTDEDKMLLLQRLYVENLEQRISLLEEENKNLEGGLTQLEDTSTTSDSGLLRSTGRFSLDLLLDR